MDKHRISFLADLAIILLISLALLSGLVFSGNWPLSHDGLRYLCHLDQFKDAFDSGILYPRWFPNYYGGYGYPIFIFYQPGYFFFSLPFAYVFPDILTASYASNVAMFFLGGAGVCFLIRRITDSRPVSLFCSMMFLLTPYIYVNVYVRGDLSELLAMFIAPWTLYFLIRLKERIAERIACIPLVLVLALTLAAMVYSHPFTSMFFYPLFCAVMVAMGLEIERKTAARFLIAGVISLVFAVIFSSPYWLTAFQMKQYVEYHNASGGVLSAENHVVHFHQLFSRFWGFGGSEPGTINDGMSFQLGLPHFIAALLGFWLNRKNKFYLYVFLLYILCVLMMTPPASFLWENIPLLNFVQFPWRLLSVIAVLQIICISGLWKFNELYPGGRTVHYVLAFIFVFTVLWNSNQFGFIKCEFDVRKAIERHREVRLEKLLVYESFNEFLPKTMSEKLLTNPRAGAPMLEVSNPACRIEEYPHSNPHHMRYRIASGEPQIILINQLYFPGWKVILNDDAFDDAYLLKNICRDGRIQVEIPAGENMYLEAFYEGPPGWRLRNLFIAVAALSVFVLIYSARVKI
ncbi:MAG: 6-pyruvoyl-tetrahydropterin synthase-related protein [Victivallales bacterium]